MDFWSLVKDYALTITAFGVIVALFISLFTLVSQKRHNNYQRLIEIYAMVNTIEEREARKIFTMHSGFTWNVIIRMV